MKEVRKVAFFDLDGTLVAPRFYLDGTTPIIGFQPEDWVKYCEERVDAYKDSVIVHQVYNYATNLWLQGWELHILTVAEELPDIYAKSDFINKSKLAWLFKDTHFVKKTDEKIKFLEDFLNKKHVDPANCLLVEDTLSTLYKCCKLGIKLMHISHIVSNCYDPRTGNLE